MPTGAGRGARRRRRGPAARGDPDRLREIEQAVAAARDAAPGLVLIASSTFTRDDRTLLGSTPEQVAAAAAGLGVDAIGVNCGEGRRRSSG